MHYLFYLSLYVFLTNAQCNVKSYGALGNDVHDDTVAIQTAINSCASKYVLIPAGTFYCGPLSITNKIGFRLQIDGTLQMAPRLTVSGGKYWPLVNGNYVNFITMTDCVSCTLLGSGTISGGPYVASQWWIPAVDSVIDINNRPFQLVVSRGSSLTIENLHFHNSPMIHIYLAGVNGATISGLTITDDAFAYTDKSGKSHTYSPNTDGIDPAFGSKNIHISQCTIDNGDDFVAVKPGPSVTNCTGGITVTNCDFYHGHGCSIGSVPGGCVDGVIFQNIRMYNPKFGCRIKTYGSTAGIVNNILYEDITLKLAPSGGTIDNCIQIDTQYSGASTNKQITKIKYVGVSSDPGVVCTSTVDLACSSGATCDDVSFNTISLSGGAMTCSNAKVIATGTLAPTLPAQCK